MDAMLVAPTADAPLTLETLVAPVRGRLRLAGLATSASGVLLIAQAGLIALLAQHVLAEHRPTPNSAARCGCGASAAAR